MLTESELKNIKSLISFAVGNGKDLDQKWNECAASLVDKIDYEISIVGDLYQQLIDVAYESGVVSEHAEHLLYQAKQSIVCTVEDLDYCEDID